MRFAVAIYPDKFQLAQIQYVRSAAIINYNMPDVWQTMTDS